MTAIEPIAGGPATSSSRLPVMKSNSAPLSSDQSGSSVLPTGGGVGGRAGGRAGGVGGGAVLSSNQCGP